VIEEMKMVDGRERKNPAAAAREKFLMLEEAS